MKYLHEVLILQIYIILYTISNVCFPYTAMLWPCYIARNYNRGTERNKNLKRTEEETLTTMDSGKQM